MESKIKVILKTIKLWKGNFLKCNHTGILNTNFIKLDVKIYCFSVLIKSEPNNLLIKSCQLKQRLKYNLYLHIHNKTFWLCLKVVLFFDAEKFIIYWLNWSKDT